MPDSSELPASVVETHISTLFFVGDRVYKLKKAVTFPFVDLSTREARERICHREVELNRRLAPDVYLGVADVLGPGGDPCDHLVVMRRLPEHRRLSTLIEDRSPRTGQVIGELARKLAAFHRTADRSPQIDSAGSPEAVGRRWDDLFAEVEPFVGSTLDEREVGEVKRLAHGYLDGRHPLFSRRIEQGAICDGHGDLQADDVFCLDDGPRVLDCIEFDDRLRHVDIADDIAFFVMDFERLGAPELGSRLVRCYEEAAGTELPPSLVDFYAAFRAMVRAMVTCMRAAQESGADAAAAAARARLLFDLCLRRLRSAQPKLVVVGGLPGTGKSTLAGALAAARGWDVLRSDVVRKERAGLVPSSSAVEPFGRGLYDPATTGEVYETLAARARELLGQGKTVVVDASFNQAHHRELMRAVAAEMHAKAVDLRCVLDQVTAARRMQARALDGRDASDATPAIAAQMAAVADPWPEAIEVPTGSRPADVLDRVLTIMG